MKFFLNDFPPIFMVFLDILKWLKNQKSKSLTIAEARTLLFNWEGRFVTRLLKIVYLINMHKITKEPVRKA